VLESLEIRDTSPLPGWPYEWVVATARLAAAPDAPENERVTDLSLAPRDPDGLVRFDADVRLLRPTTGGNRRVVVVVPNRGMTGGVPFSLDGQLQMQPASIPDPGDGFLLEQGWTLAWCGWQWDVARDEGYLGVSAPLADVEPGWLRIEFRLDAAQADHPLSDSSPFFRFTEYPTVDLDDPDAVLTVRETPLGERRVVPRDHWRFSDAVTVELDGAFLPFRWYELGYRSDYAPVAGVGLLATRDVGAHLRQSHDHALAYGVSQSGRFLRQFLFDGMNVDEHGRRVFDGVFAHIASARRGEFNCRYAQPGLTHPLNPGYGPPYDTAHLLERQRSLGGAPKLFLTNSAWEYWRGDGALVHQDATTGSDLPDDPDARNYLIAGTDHMGAYAIKEFMPVANPSHLLDASTVLRALFVRLDRWACDGQPPPPSQVPRRADGTAVERSAVLDSFHGVAKPDLDALPWTPMIDPATPAWPWSLGDPQVALVSAVDATGNELAGIRLPAVAVPAAAFTGWNPRVLQRDLPNVLYEFVGSLLPLQSNAPPSDRAAYESEVRAAAHTLAGAGFLLDRDIERTVRDALGVFDAAHRDHS
jgi:hypothetical protein